jgi:ribose transport system ATP-binding protein
MDEPTRGIDVGAKYEIYSIIDRLAAAGSGVLIISSELEELLGICDRILVMSRGELYGAFARADFDSERILRAAFREEEMPAHETAE